MYNEDKASFEGTLNGIYNNIESLRNKNGISRD